MKRLRIIFMVALSSLVLVACGSQDASTGNNSKGIQLTGDNSGNNYQNVIKNGHYLVGKARGVDVDQNQNPFNVSGFQSGLLNLSKQQFAPDKYIFQEGQYLNANTVQNWLGRKSKQDPQGLNPPQKKGQNTPQYLQQINEQDFMTQNGSNLSLKGMSIGLGMNSIYYYTKQKYGPQYTEKIPQNVMEREGKNMANEILARLRKNKRTRDIPVMIALYQQAPNDSLASGNYFATSYNDPGTTKVDSWTPLNQRNYVFPIANGSKGPNSNDLASFNEFKNQVQNFFPNLSGVTARVQYKGSQLQAMHVNITTQFYSQTEIIAFTQYLQTAAQKYLPSNAPIDITVQSTNGIQSFLNRSSGGKSFSSHIFNGDD